MLDALLGNAILRADASAHPSALQIVATIKDHPAGTRSMKARAERLHGDLLSRRSAQEYTKALPGFQDAGFHRLVDDVLGS
jgi:hypothetical protein